MENILTGKSLPLAENLSSVIENKSTVDILNDELLALIAQYNSIKLRHNNVPGMVDIIVRASKAKQFNFFHGTEIQKVPAKYYPAKSIHIKLFNKFIAIVDRDFKTKKMVKDYAKDLFVTAGYLNGCIKKASGYPATYHISKRVIEEAKYKALYTENSMKEIAYELGFDDIAHFSKYFKNVSGQCFTAFKKQCVAYCA